MTQRHSKGLLFIFVIATLFDFVSSFALSNARHLKITRSFHLTALPKEDLVGDLIVRTAIATGRADMERQSQERADVISRLQQELVKTKGDIKDLKAKAKNNDRIFRDHLEFKEQEVQYLNEQLEVRRRQYQVYLYEKEAYIGKLEDYIHKLQADRQSLRKLGKVALRLVRKRISKLF